MSDVPTILAQAEAVELLTVNHAGFVDILRELVRKNKRTPQELAMSEAYLPALRAAVKTMRYIHAHANEIREDLRLPLTTGASGDVQNPRSEKLAGVLPSKPSGQKAVRDKKK